MNIYDAVKATRENDKFVTREQTWWGTFVKLKPTNSSEGFISIRKDAHGPYRTRWQPTADDVTADDWIVID